MNPYQCVIWDWNGTLADDLQASLQATNDILRHRGKPPITLEQYYAYMDSPISRFYEHLFDLRQVTMLEIGREFSQYYPKYFHHLHDGVPLLLQRLQTKGIHQVILSASHRKPVEENTARLSIRQVFRRDHRCRGSAGQRQNRTGQGLDCPPIHPAGKYGTDW